MTAAEAELPEVPSSPHPSTEERREVAFPDLAVLQLLFGYRALDDLCGAFADCVAWNEAAGPLVAALLPRRPSSLWLTW